MDEKELLQPEAKPTAGQQFVKSIRPAGCALFLALAVLVTAICFTGGRRPIRGYAPPMTMADYAADPAALVTELEEHVFPALPEYDMTAAVTGDTVTVTIDGDHFVVARAAILQYFTEDVITFIRAE